MRVWPWNRLAAHCWDVLGDWAFDSRWFPGALLVAWATLAAPAWTADEAVPVEVDQAADDRLWWRLVARLHG